MPSYPTGKTARSSSQKAQPRPRPKRPGRDTRNPGLPAKAFKRTGPTGPRVKPRGRERALPPPSPRRSPGRRPPGGGGTFGRKVRGPFLRGPFGAAFNIGDYYLRRYFPGAPVIPGDLAGWRIKHGPNVYSHPYIQDPSKWHIGYTPNAAPTGPQTALLSGQGSGIHDNGVSTFAEVLVARPSANSHSYWIPNKPASTSILWRYANYLTVVREGSSLDTGGLPPLGFMQPQPLPAPLMPPRWPIPPWEQPLPAFPLPEKAPKPDRGFANPLPPFPVFENFPDAAPDLGDQPKGAIAPGTKPGTVPNVHAAAATAAGPALAPRVHRIAPPRIGEKEPPKGKLARVLWGVAAGLGTITEGMDLVGAAHKSLPKEYRAKAKWFDGKPVAPSRKRQLEAVYKNAYKIDLNEFAYNYFWMNLEDEVLGRVDDRANRATGNKSLAGASRTSRTIDLEPISDMIKAFRGWTGT